MAENVFSTVNKRKINYSLNALKCVAIFAVITMHSGVYHWGGDFGKTIVLISRFAVPVFFLISGFYSFYVDEDYALKKYETRIVRLIILIIISNLLYIAFSYITQPDYNVMYLFTFERCIHTILFNIPPSDGFHLWFLQALLYCYILFWIITKLKLKISRGYILIPILFSITLILTELLMFMGNDIGFMYSRNFLFMGLPFFYLGFFIHDKQYKIKELSNLFVILGIITSIFIILLELTIIHDMMEFSIGVLFLSISLFILCVNNPDHDIFIASWIGGNLYTSMYVLHLLVIMSVQSFLNIDLGYLNLVIYFIGTALLALIIYFFKQLFNQKEIHEKDYTQHDELTNEKVIPSNQHITNGLKSINPQNETPEEMEARIREEIMKELDAEQRKK